MKRILSKYSRPALTAVLVLALTTVLSIGSAFAMVEISDKFYITDEAEVISEATENHIVNLNAYLEANCSGAQIGIVVVDFLDGMDIEDYCYKMFDQMQLGSADEDNGILLLLTIGEENYWCMQGKGIAGDLTAAEIDDILWYNLEPDFAVADYDAGVLQTFNILTEELCDIYGVAYPSTLDTTSEDYYGNVDYADDEPLTIVDWLIFIVFCLALLAFALWVFTMVKKVLRKAFGSSKASDYEPVPHSTVRRTVRRRPRPIIFVGTGGRPPHRPHHNHWGHTHHGHSHSRPTSRPTSSSRPTSRPTSRPSMSSSRPVSRPSRPSGFGGGGMSRGGGAGRRGR